MHFSTLEGQRNLVKLLEEQAEIHIEPGDKVKKVSGKPFKSTQQINTVKDFTINPNTGKIALTFVEDESIVDAYICYRHQVFPEPYV